MKPVTEYELRFINEFLTTGLQMIPNSDTEAYNSEQDYEFSQFVTERLKKFYELYRTTPPQLVGDKEW
jgi:predicted solute-binding protein